MDISFHRDDLRIRKHPIIPKSIDLDFNIEEKHVILVDDVVYTGRSVRSALDALMTFGRPNTVELLTLISEIIQGICQFNLIILVKVSMF